MQRTLYGTGLACVDELPEVLIAARGRDAKTRHELRDAPWRLGRHVLFDLERDAGQRNPTARRVEAQGRRGARHQRGGAEVRGREAASIAPVVLRRRGLEKRSGRAVVELSGRGR